MCMKFEGMKPNPNYCCAHYKSFKDEPKEAPKKCLTENSPQQNGVSRIAASLNTVVDAVVEIFEGD